MLPAPKRPLRFSKLRALLRGFLVGYCAGSLFLPVSPALLHAASSDSLLNQDPNTIFREEVPSMPKEPESMEQVLERSRFIRYSQERWNEMRDRLESGESLIPPPAPQAPTPERKPLPQQPPPLGPGINVVLPYESGLSISGRKVIDFKLDDTLYSQPD